MNDNLRYSLYQIGRNKIIRKLFILYYELAVQVVKRSLLNKSFVNHLYLKGSFGSESFIPVVSDVDFFIIGNASDKNKKKVERLFKRLNKFFPMVSDFDFHGKNEAEYLFNFSGAKYFPATDWRILKGKKTDFTYRFYPRKFYLDIVHEIYFQYEWLFKNLKKRVPGDKYKTLVIQRQYEKVIDLINHLTLHQDNYYLRKRKFVEKNEWRNFSNERIIRIFNKLILNSSVLNRISRLYGHDFRDRDISSVLKEEFYKENVKIYDDNIGFDYEKKSHYYPLENFKLFYLTGCIDSYIIFDWCEITNDKLGGLYLKALYFSKLLEKRGNTIHDKEYYFNNFQEALNLKNLLINSFRYEKYAPLNYFGKDVFIHVGEHSSENYIEYLSRLSADIPVLSIMITKSTEFVKKPYGEIIVTTEVFDSEIVSKEALLQLALHWCFGAKNIIFADKNTYTNMKSVRSHILGKLKYYDFVRVKSKESRELFFWVSTYERWVSIKKFFVKNFGLASNELMDYLLTSRPIEAKPYNHLHCLSKEIETYNYNVLELDSHSFITHYQSVPNINLDVVFLNIINQKVSLNEIGIPFKSDCNDEFWFNLKNFKNDDLKDPYKTLWFLKKLIRPEQVNLLGNFKALRNDGPWKLDGLCAVLEEGSEEISFHTAEIGNTLKITVKYDISKVFGLTPPPDSSNWIISFGNKITRERMEISFGSPSLETNYSVLKANMEELYSCEFSIINPRETNELCLRIALDLESNKKYTISLKKISEIKTFESEKFEFYNKIEKRMDLSLGFLHKNFYKIVINLNKDFTGPFGLENKKTSEKYQKFQSKDQVLIIFHNNLKECSSLSIRGPESFSYEAIDSIDILKKIN